MKSRQPPFEAHMRRPASADEANRARPGAEFAHRLLLGGDHLRSRRHAEIAVGVHPQERAFALPFEKVAPTFAGGRWSGSADDGFLAFEPPGLLHLVELRGEQLV